MYRLLPDPSLHLQCDGCGYIILNTYHFKNSSANGFISFPCSLLIFHVLNSATWPRKKLQHKKLSDYGDKRNSMFDKTIVANMVHIELTSVSQSVFTTINETINYIFRAMPTQ